MIGFLEGKLLKSTPDRVLLSIHGVGYEVNIPLSTFSVLEKASGEVALHIHTHVREDAIELYGFSTERERLLFEKLIGVSGIGPKLARVVLSGLSTSDLVSALVAQDTAWLSSVPGIGKKTAERMIVELKDRVQDLGGDEPAEPLVSAESDLVLALVNLGYKEREAQRAVGEAQREVGEDVEFEELLRASLKRLSKV